MASSRSEGPYPYPEQPGLEVAAAEHQFSSSSPQVAAAEHQFSSSPQVVAGDHPFNHGDPTAYKEVQSVASPYTDDNDKYVAAGGASAHAAHARPKSRKRLWIIVGVVALVVVVAAVVGGVLGSRAAQSNSDSAEASAESSASPSNSPLPPEATPTSSVNTTLLRANSRLAVTGRRFLNDKKSFEARLIFQGDDNVIRMSKFSSDADDWGLPIPLSGLAPAKPGSPLAASMALKLSQYKFFYVSPKDELLGAWSKLGSRDASGDTLTTPRLSGVRLDHDNSKLASYWPYVVAQYPNGTLRRVVYNEPDGGWFYAGPLTTWENDDNNFDHSAVADLGSPLAVVPTVPDMHNPFAAGVIARAQNGDFMNFGFGGNDTGSAWNTKPQQNISFPKVAAVGALAVTRPGSGNKLTDTYVLYQDSDDEIKSMRLDDSDSGWKKDGPTLGKADKGTDIACLTEQIGDDESAPPVKLSESKDMSRCYFMVKGLIKEVKLEDDGSWKELGFIPLE